MSTKNILKSLWLALFFSLLIIPWLPVRAQQSWPFTNYSCWCTGTFKDCNESGSNCIREGQSYNECVAPTTVITKPANLSANGLPIRQSPNPNTPGSWFSTATSEEDCQKMVGVYNENFKTRVDNILGTHRFYNLTSCTMSPDTDCSAAKTPPPTPESPQVNFEIRKPVLNILIPNLNFSDINTTTDQNGNIQNPWIGEYIVAIYQLLVNVASILGVILIIREGIRIIVSVGEEKVEAYQHIGRILIGLVLAWFSYVILYNLNSSLVAIRPLNIQILVNKIISDSDSNNPSFESDKDFDEIIKSYQSSQGGAKPITNVTACSWCAPGVVLNRDNFCSQLKNKQIKPCGYVPLDNLAKFSTCDVIVKGEKKTVQLMDKTSRTVVYAHPAAQASICKAVQIAMELGYEIRFSSVYRDFATQAANWCEKGGQGGLRAEPGCSVHGTGLAQDLYLFKDGKQLTSIDGDLQCNPKMAEDNKKLANIMYAADPINFRRLEFESWHFEYGGKNDSCHLKTDSVPKCCSDKSCREDASAYCSGRKK